MGASLGSSASIVAHTNGDRRSPKQLSAREREILTLLNQGQTAKEVAFGLRIAHSTVRVLRARARKKLGPGGHAALREDAAHLIRHR
jgi:DNA-binding NarL/FixJ family response regulator